MFCNPALNYKGFAYQWIKVTKDEKIEQRIWLEFAAKLPFFLFCRHAYHSVSTPPVYPPKNVADLKTTCGHNVSPEFWCRHHPSWSHACYAGPAGLCWIGDTARSKLGHVSSSPSFISERTWIWLYNQGDWAKKDRLIGNHSIPHTKAEKEKNEIFKFRS